MLGENDVSPLSGHFILCSVVIAALFTAPLCGLLEEEATAHGGNHMDFGIPSSGFNQYVLLRNAFHVSEHQFPHL